MASPASDRCCGAQQPAQAGRPLLSGSSDAPAARQSSGGSEPHLDASEFHCYLCYELLLDPVVGACVFCFAWPCVAFSGTKKTSGRQGARPLPRCPCGARTRAMHEGVSQSMCRRSGAALIVAGRSSLCQTLGQKASHLISLPHLLPFSRTHTNKKNRRLRPRLLQALHRRLDPLARRRRPRRRRAHVAVRRR